MNPQGGKLPRLGARKATQQSLFGQQAAAAVGAGEQEKRRFVTVVRPLSYFPEPEPPPNFTPPSLNLSSGKEGGSVKGRPPSPAPFGRQHVPLPQSQRPRAVHRPPATGDFSLSGNGYGSASLRLQLVGGGSGWDLTAIKRGYNGANGGQYRSNYRSPDRLHGQYPPFGSFDTEEKIGMPPWNPHFGYSKVLSQQNYPLTDDWRRHLDARRRALQRKRNKRRLAADGASFVGNPERFQNGTTQTEDDFEELVRRAGDVEAAAQTEMYFESIQKYPVATGVLTPTRSTRDSATQVNVSDLPEFDAMVEPAIDQIVNETLEQAFVEAMEEEEIKEIRRRRIEFQQMKMAELTTSKLMDISIE